MEKGESFLFVCFTRMYHIKVFDFTAVKLSNELIKML